MVMKKQEKEMLVKLRTVSETGVNLYLDGNLATPEEIALSCLNSSSLYMPDYVIDEEGRLRELRYDKVSHF